VNYAHEPPASGNHAGVLSPSSTYHECNKQPRYFSFQIFFIEIGDALIFIDFILLCCIIDITRNAFPYNHKQTECCIVLFYLFQNIPILSRKYLKMSQRF